MASVAVDAFAQRADEGLLGPAADAGVGIGRDVGAVDRAERRLDRPAAGECLPPSAVWHAWQLPIAASCAPFAISAGSNEERAGTASGATGSAAHAAHTAAVDMITAKGRIGTLVYSCGTAIAAQAV